MPAYVPVEIRFWAKVAKSDGCWLWTGSKQGDGYGCIGIKGKSVLAHRLSFRLAHGFEANDCVLHTCDTPACVRPDHLYAGNQAQNAADRSARNRDGGRKRRGAGNGRAVLTPEQVVEIRALYDPSTRWRRTGFSQSDLAKRFGVDQTAISNVLRGRTWQD